MNLWEEYENIVDCPALNSSERDNQVDTSQVFTIRKYEPANWFTPKGAFKYYLSYVKKGIPETNNWRFITLTIDPNKYIDEKEAFEIGNRHIKQFLYLMRKRYGNFKFMRKLEFHKNGFPHWHILAGITSKIDLDFIRKIWGKGRIDVERIKPSTKGKTFDYLFKYACKKQHIPQWVGEQNRFRFVSFSKGFFTGSPALKNPFPSEEESKKRIDLRTIFERLARWQKTVIVSVSCAGCFVEHIKCELNFHTFSEVEEELCRIKESESQANKASIRLIGKLEFSNPIYFVHLVNSWFLDVDDISKFVTPEMFEDYMNWDLKLVA